MNQSNFTVSVPGDGGGGGGSGGSGGSGGPLIFSLKSAGEQCTENKECGSDICDLSETASGVRSNNYGTCQVSLCGNGIKNEGETNSNCPQDASLPAIFKSDKTGFVAQSLPFVIGIAILSIIAVENINPRFANKLRLSTIGKRIRKKK